MTTAAQRRLAERQAAASVDHLRALAFRARLLGWHGKLGEASELEASIPQVSLRGPDPEFVSWAHAFGDCRSRYESAHWRAQASLWSALYERANLDQKDPNRGRLLDEARRHDSLLVALDRAVEQLATRYSFDASALRLVAVGQEALYQSTFGTAEPGAAEIAFQLARFDNIFPEVQR